MQLIFDKRMWLHHMLILLMEMNLMELKLCKPGHRRRGKEQILILWLISNFVLSVKSTLLSTREIKVAFLFLSAR